MATAWIYYYSAQEKGQKVKKIYLLTALIIVLSNALVSGDYDKVKISPDISFIYVYHKGKAVKVHRIQDTKNKLTGWYAKTYRPGTTIQPIIMNKDIQTIGEVELIKFMRDKVNKRKGLIIDVRQKAFHDEEAIPSSVYISLKTVRNDKTREKLFETLGMKKQGDGKWDGDDALELAVYCHGLWCSLAPKFINLMTKYGYPTDKIKYYRGGMQMWKILGFTTIEEIE